MHVVVTGGTGLIGRPLCRSLRSGGHEVTVISRNPATARQLLGGDVQAVAWNDDSLAQVLGRAGAVLNLTGENLGAGRWTQARKNAIVDSRLTTTRALVTAVGRLDQRPAVLVSASAVGFYGPRSQPVDESANPGRDFLARTCLQWEEEALAARRLGVRVVLLRQGVVLARQGSALDRLVLPFRLFAGGPLGSGRQALPWIHIDDAVGLYRFAMDTPAASGPINAVAPDLRSNGEFARELGKVLGRPSWLPAPAFALKAVLGEMSDMVLTGQPVLPAVAQRLGFRFRYPQLRPALADLLDRK